jgi:hypothetical protein
LRPAIDYLHRLRLDRHWPALMSRRVCIVHLLMAHSVRNDSMIFAEVLRGLKDRWRPIAFDVPFHDDRRRANRRR